MTTFENFTESMKPFHNHICILYDCELVRLLGVHLDWCDYYYIVKPLGQHKKSYFASATGHIVSLKGKIPDERYVQMNNVFNLNGTPEEREFIITMDTTNPEMDDGSNDIWSS